MSFFRVSSEFNEIENVFVSWDTDLIKMRIALLISMGYKAISLTQTDLVTHTASTVLVDHTSNPMEVQLITTVHHRLSQKVRLVEVHATEINGHEHCTDLCRIHLVLIDQCTYEKVYLVFGQRATIPFFHYQVGHTEQIIIEIHFRFLYSKPLLKLK
jgi:hypothetical protein